MSTQLEVTPVSTEKPKVEVKTSSTLPSANSEFVIDRDELLNLRDLGLLTTEVYLYFATKLDYGNKANPSIELAYYAERWSTERKPLTAIDVQISLGKLAKKGFFGLQTKQLSLTFQEPDTNPKEN